MRIGLIVDGQSEFDALPMLFPQLRAATGNIFLGPIRSNLHPKAKLPIIANECLHGVRVLLGQDVDAVVILFDREDRDECPGELAQALRQDIARTVAIPVTVVIKDRTFENWLVSDCGAIRSHPARFTLGATAERSVANKADQIDAERWIKATTRGRSYQKVKDSITILGSADPLRMAGNSRSFRRFLRCIGHPAYADQSQRPAR